MHSLAPRSVVEIWEYGQRRGNAERALKILGAAFPDHDPGVLADLPVGEHDALLLQLHERSFGHGLESQARCPGCSAVLRFELDTRQLLAGRAAAARTEESLSQDGYEVHFRLPAAGDLAALASCSDLEAARAALLERCVLRCRHQGQELVTEELPEEVVAAVAQRMEERDPLAEIPLRIDCNACSHRWEAVLDIGSYLWVEVSTLAERLLYEVHALARAYGWSEAEVLALGAERRSFYLAMATDS